MPSTNGRPTKAQPARLAVNTSSLAADLVYRSLSASAVTPPVQPSRLFGWLLSQPNSLVYSRFTPYSPRSMANSARCFPVHPSGARRPLSSVMSSSWETSVTSCRRTPASPSRSAFRRREFSRPPGSLGRISRISPSVFSVPVSRSSCSILFPLDFCVRTPNLLLLNSPAPSRSSHTEHPAEEGSPSPVREPCSGSSFP